MRYWPVNDLKNKLNDTFYRVASSKLFHTFLLPKEFEPPKSFENHSPLRLEIVSHCWKYAHLLSYQLSSLVLCPPKHLSVTMTVYHCNEDRKTEETLNHFGDQVVNNVRWNFRECPKEQLFRRAIGRNEAALKTNADWIWFTDCDQVFGEGCLDSLADILPDHRGHLLFPRQVSCTELLESNHEMLSVNRESIETVEIDPTHFVPKDHDRAIGALQILRGDAARSIGYCNSIKHFQTPAKRWKKTYEDRTFRRLVGSQGDPIDLPHLYRIEHVAKGRKVVQSNLKAAA